MSHTASRFTLVVLTAATAVAGCQAVAPATSGPTVALSPSAVGTLASGSSAPPTSTAASTPPATATPGVSPAPDADIELGDGPFFLDDPASGLDQLTSYEESLTISFDGTSGQQASHWQKKLTFVHTSQPPASGLTVETSGDLPNSGLTFDGELAGASYVRTADGNCVGRLLDPATSTLALREPARLLPGLMGAIEVGAEEANGVASNHFTFDERAMAESRLATTSGEIWVAAAGGYVVRYLQHTAGQPGYFGEGVDGSRTWDYELSEVGQPLRVPVPVECQLDAPVLADAANVLVLPKYVRFDSTSSLADAMAAYAAELMADGWLVKREPVIGDDSAFAIYSKDGRTLNVIAARTDTGSHFDVLPTGVAATP